MFSDIVMPGGINGVDLAEELKRRQPNLPTILTTGYSDAARNREALQESPLLLKPYRLHSLEAALKAAMTDTSVNATANGDRRDWRHERRRDVRH